MNCIPECADLLELGLDEVDHITRDGRREWVRIANPSSTARNPGFDVTPADLITGFITPAGILKPRELWKRRKALAPSSGITAGAPVT